MQVEHRWTTVPWRTSAGRAKNATPPRILPTSNRFGNLLHSSETILYLPDPPNAFHQSVHNARVSPAGQGTTRTRRKNLARYRRRLRARQLQLPGAWTFGPTPATATATPSSKTNPSTLFKIITAAVDNVFTAASAIFTSFGDELVDSGDTRDADGGGGGGGDAGGGDGGDTGGGGGAGRSGGDPDGGGGAGGSGGDPDGGGGGGAGGSDPDGGGGGGAGGSGDDEDQAKKQPIGDEEDEEESRESHDSAQQDATRGTGLYTYQLLVRTQRTDVAQHLLNDATAIITAAGLADLLTTSLSDTFALADRIVVSCNDLFDKDAEDETPASSQTSVYRNVWSSDDDNHHDHIFGEERQRYAQAIDQLLAGVAGGLGDAGGLGGSRAARHHDHGSDDAFHRDLQSAEDERSARLLAGDVGDGFGEAGEEELTARNDHQRARGFLAAESEEQVREQATAERSRGQDPEYDISRILSDSKQFWESIAGLNITEGELSPEAQSEEIRTVVDLLFKNYPASSPEMGNSPAPASPVLRPATSEDGNEDVADELDNEKGSGLGLWGLPIRAPPSMAGIDVFAFTRARADELPPCLPKTGPKPHMANIRVPSIVKDKTAIGKDCWGCGTTIKVVGAHTPWGALCRGSACSRVIGSGWPLLDLAIAGDAAPVSLRRGGQGFARNGQATVEAGFVLHRNDQNRWLAVKAELNAEKAWLTGLHPEAEAKFTELVRGGNGVKECFTCAIAISGQARQCLWPTKQICQSCWWAWRDAFNSNRMEEAAEQFDPFVLWMLFSIARRQVQWTCLPCGKPCVSYRDTTTPGGPRLDAEYLNVFAGVLRTCSSCSSGWISYRRNLQRILQPEELMSPASEFIYWLQSPKETRCVIKNCPYVWNKTSGLVRPSALPPDEDWHRSGSRCSGFARSEYICSGHLERVGGVKACDMTPVVARELQEICACYEHQAKVPRRPAGWRSAFRAALTDARDQLVDGTRCFVLGCGAVYRSEDRSPWYPKELPNGEWYPFCPDCDKHVQKILNNSANLTPHTYLVYQHHITAKKILAETSYISIWDDFATEPAIPVMVYLTKYHLRRDTTVCAASPAFSTDPVISELFPVRISSRMGYNWHRRDNADHSGKKHRLPATFVGFILGGLNIFRYLFDVCRLNGRTTQDFVEAVTNEVFQIPSKARQACFFPDKKVIDNYNSVMAQEAEDVQLGPWKWGGKKHQQCHARAMGTGANEWKTKNPDTILQCAITGELFRVAGSHVNHSHFFAKCGCLMPMLSNTLLGQYETVLDHLLLQVYTGDDIAKATKIRRSIHDEMMKSFSAYVDGTAPIVQSAQRLVNTLKDDDEMMTWGGAALGDAEMCQKFYDEFTSSTDRPVALAFQDYLRLLCPKPITAEEYQKNLLWLRWEK